MRFAIYHKKSIHSVWIKYSIGMILFICLFYLIEVNLKPAVLSAAEVQVKTIASQTIYHAVNEKFQNQDIEKIVNIERDVDGKVVLIQTNTIQFNKLSVEIAINVQSKLNEIVDEDIYIPIGQVFGNHFFANAGPKIKISVLPIGTVQISIEDKIEQAGINQIKHSVFLNIRAQMKIIAPLSSKNIEIEDAVLLSEYVVVGSVPNTYVQFPIGK